jgi:hypothetical protein
MESFFSDQDDLKTLCQKAHVGLDAIAGIAVRFEVERTIVHSVLDHLYTQLSQHCPDISIEEYRALAVRIIDGVSFAVHAAASR